MYAAWHIRETMLLCHVQLDSARLAAVVIVDVSSPNIRYMIIAFAMTPATTDRANGRVGSDHNCGSTLLCAPSRTTKDYGVVHSTPRLCATADQTKEP